MAYAEWLTSLHTVVYAKANRARQQQSRQGEITQTRMWENLFCNEPIQSWLSRGSVDGTFCTWWCTGIWGQMSNLPGIVVN